MTVSIICVTENGCALSRKISDSLSEKYIIACYAFHKSCDEKSVPFTDLGSLVSDIFCRSDALIFVCACGIAVRSIAPLLKSKTTDPAVIVVDDNGNFAIPILSGHLGGANALAKLIAEKIGAVPVITTATDIGGKFSPDSFSKSNNLIISDLLAAKQIAAAALKGEKIGLASDYECKNIPPEIAVNKCCRTGICISSDISKKPFEITLNLVPKNIIIGVGCKRGTLFTAIEKHISESLLSAGIDIKRLCGVATIDIKSDENGLLEFCEKRRLKLFVYTADELMSVCGNFTKSEFVLSKTGADNVCERSVVKHGGKLIMPKTSYNGITVSAGEMPFEIDFERGIL